VNIKQNGPSSDFKTTDEWTLSQERQFTEDLVQKRFNFLLLVFTFIVAGALSANSQVKLKIILTIGWVLFALLSATVFRAYVKLDELLRILHQNPLHPISIVQERISARGCSLFWVHWVIGALIPGVVALGLLFVTALAWLGCVKFE
jgi:hypothetical protein